MIVEPCINTMKLSVVIASIKYHSEIAISLENRFTLILKHLLVCKVFENSDYIIKNNLCVQCLSFIEILLCMCQLLC